MMTLRWEQERVVLVAVENNITEEQVKAISKLYKKVLDADFKCNEMGKEKVIITLKPRETMWLYLAMKHFVEKNNIETELYLYD